MSDDPGQFDPIEAALLDLDAAQKAGVFEQTPVDAGSLLVVEPGPVRRSRLGIGLRWASAAAVIVFVVGVGSLMFSPRAGLDGGGHRAAIGGGAAAEPEGCDGSFLGCFAGPAEVVASGCIRHDYDADGDVDLADFRAFQLSCEGRLRIH